MAASAPPNTVTLTIDGQEVTVPRGTLVIEAARQIGIEIPVFCYHPKLSLVGACRMCSCEIQMPPPPGQQPRPPGILTACTTQVAPGMTVNTLGDLSTKHREAVIEFLLINHPLDCPVCDAGGECPLQDNSHAWGPKESRFEEEKRLARKGAIALLPGGAGPGAVHRVLPLHALYGRGAGAGGAGVLHPRLHLPAAHHRRPAHALPLPGQHHRPLPLRGPDQRDLPLPGPPARPRPRR